MLKRTTWRTWVAAAAIAVMSTGGAMAGAQASTASGDGLGNRLPTCMKSGGAKGCVDHVLVAARLD